MAQSSVTFALAEHFHRLQLVAPIVLGNFVDEVIAASGIEVLSRMALLFLGIALIQLRCFFYLFE